MLPRDWIGDDPTEAQRYLDTLTAWQTENTRLARAQHAARRELDDAGARIGVLNGWLGLLQGELDTIEPRGATYDGVRSDLAQTTAQIAHDDLLVSDFRSAYAVGTARLLGDVAIDTPVLLLPLRIETHWAIGELMVRIFPDEIAVDSHDERLTPIEQQSGARYWAGIGDDTQTQQAWEDLVRQVGATRAVWVARTTEPGQPPPATRGSGWDTAVSAGLLPDRFAVIAVGDHAFRSVRGGDQGARVSWGAAIPARLDYDVFAAPDDGSWLTSFTQAEAVGMAVRVPVDADTAPIESLLVLGLRNDTAAPDLARLLTSHAVTGGLELLANGAPTNNSSDVRAALNRTDQSAAARTLLGGGSAPADGTAGARLATLLGVPASTLVGISGADQPVRTAAAMRTLVGSGTDGALRAALGDGGAAWQVVEAAGPVATMRVGRQPYGVLPASVPARWVPIPGELATPLAAALHQWGLATGPQLDADPLTPVTAPGSGSARRVTPAQPDLMPAVMIESAVSLSWQTAEVTYSGLDALVGPTGGPDSPAAYLEQIAAADPAALPGLRSTLPSMLAQVGLAAKQTAADDQARMGVDAALRALAATVDAETPDPGRVALGRLLAATLDAASHRFDAWVTGAVTERLTNLRTTPGRSAVGAFGWLTDLRPAAAPRSAGHILAPSLAQAATAAVLRAGYSAEVAVAGRADGSRQPMAVDLSSDRVRTASSTLAAVRAGQPLAAVLGRRFEDDLVTAGLQLYLATCRKLTRFRTGTALEGVEDTRRQALNELVADQQHLAALQDTAKQSQTVATSADAQLVRAQQALAVAVAAAAPYVAMQDRADQLSAMEIPRLTAELATVEGQRPVPAERHRTIVVPVP